MRGGSRATRQTQPACGSRIYRHAAAGLTGTPARTHTHTHASTNTHRCGEPALRNVVGLFRPPGGPRLVQRLLRHLRDGAIPVRSDGADDAQCAAGAQADACRTTLGQAGEEDAHELGIVGEGIHHIDRAAAHAPQHLKRHLCTQATTASAHARLRNSIWGRNSAPVDVWTHKAQPRRRLVPQASLT